MSGLFPLPGSVREDTAHIAYIDTPYGTADLRLSPGWLPVLVFDNLPPDTSKIRLPSFEELDRLCSEQSYAETGQAFLVIDVLAREGLCTYRLGAQMRQAVRHNLEEGIFAVAQRSSEL